MKVSYYSPLPPERSGIADYSALLLPALGRLVELVLVRRGRTRPVAADVALYHVGNDPEAHGWIVDALKRRPGVVVLHDFVLHHLVAGLTIGRKDGHGYLAAMERDAGIPGRLLAHGVLDGRVSPPWETRPDEFPLAGEVLANATGLIVHSHYVENRVVEAGYDGPIWRIEHPAWPSEGRPAALRLLRASECEQAHPSTGRGLRVRPHASSEREAPARRARIARLRRGPIRGGRRGAHRLRRGGAALVSDGRVRCLHLAALAHDGRDVRQCHSRALARTAARRQRSRLVLRVTG